MYLKKSVSLELKVLKKNLPNFPSFLCHVSILLIASLLVSIFLQVAPTLLQLVV
jgi:hypothetical protein